MNGALEKENSLPSNHVVRFAELSLAHHDPAGAEAQEKLWCAPNG